MKLFFILTLLIVKTFALDISEEKVLIHKEIEVSYNIRSLNQAIENKKLFKKEKHFTRTFQNRSHDGLWLKISLENPTDKLVKRVFLTKWDRVKLDLFLVENKRLISFEELSSDEYIKHSSVIKIPAYGKMDFYINVKTKKSNDQFFYMYLIDEKRVNSFIINDERLYHHGLFFGILLTMAMYSFFMHFSIRDKGYLYLGFYQVSVLIAISDIREYLFLFLENYPTLANFLLRGMFEYVIMLFSILFTKEFLNTKKEMPKFNFVLNISLILLLSLNAIDSNVNYASFLYIIFVFAGIYVFINKKNLLALFYTLGFLGYPVYFLVMNLGILFNWNFYFDTYHAKQVFTCIESFALSMALYLKIRTIVKEKQKEKEESLKKEKALLEQSRFASMGEMLASIAHQWRQPLNHISITLANLQLAFESGKLDKKYLEKKAKEADEQLKYMSLTIESFSSFFAIKGKKEEFKLFEVCEYTIKLLESRLGKNQITLDLVKNDMSIYSNYKNELIQVLTIVLNNAIDALLLNNIKNKKIQIIINEKQIIINDNAGGIPENIKSRIFDPYFTTKNKSQGTGLGLYTSKIIMNNLIKGEIETKNIENGSSFIISI